MHKLYKNPSIYKKGYVNRKCNITTKYTRYKSNVYKVKSRGNVAKT